MRLQEPMPSRQAQRGTRSRGLDLEEPDQWRVLLLERDNVDHAEPLAGAEVNLFPGLMIIA
jgi:hypothetical protein